MDRNIVVKFESDILEALKEKYYSLSWTNKDDTQISKESIDQTINSTFSVRFNLLQFFDAYLKSSEPQERLSKLMHELFDLKLQLFYILECDQGLYNSMLYDKGFDQKKPKTIELLIKMSIDQTTIVKSRILWERMINFVSIYISGEELKSSSKYSKKAKFFKISINTPWEFLHEYKTTLEWFDEKLRTPEVHGGSVLRKAFQERSEEIDSNTLLVLSNIAMNVFYPNIMNIVQGLEPSHKVWVSGMQEEPIF